MAYFSNFITEKGRLEGDFKFVSCAVINNENFYTRKVSPVALIFCSLLKDFRNAERCIYPRNWFGKESPGGSKVCLGMR